MRGIFACRDTRGIFAVADARRSGLDANRHPAAAPVIDAVGIFGIVMPAQLDRRAGDACAHEELGDLFGARLDDTLALDEDARVREPRRPAPGPHLHESAGNLLRVLE